MDKNEFVRNFASQFDETDVSEISLNTEFRNIEEWSSLYALSIIAMVDEAYDVKLTGDDIRNSTTVNDILELVRSRIK